MVYRLHYYDLILVAIASCMSLGVTIGVITTVNLAIAVPLMGFVAVVIIGHALFIAGPVDELSDLSDEVEPTEVPGIATAAELVD